MFRRLTSRRALLVGAGSLLTSQAWVARPAWARQHDLSVAQLANRLHAVPLLLARERRWFSEMAGISVRGFIGSSEGGATLRNALAAELPYGEVSLPAAMAPGRTCSMPVSEVHMPSTSLRSMARKTSGGLG